MSKDFAARHPRLAELFGIDLRSLALFRFGLGLVLLVVLLHDFCDLTAFYSDLGVMPRAWAVQADSFNRLSIYFLNGQRSFVALLLLVQTCGALLLMLGWRTRLAVVVSFVMWISLMNRNVLLIGDGDVLIACLLFWGMFLPLGARFSVDAALSAPSDRLETSHISWGSAGLLLQVASVAFFGALLKSGPEWHPQFTAAYYALSLDRFATPLGQWLLQSPELLHNLSAMIWWLELLGPLLLFLPWFNRQIRLPIMLGFMAVFIGLKLTMELGYLPFAGLVAWTPFVGGWLWDAGHARRQRRAPAKPLRIYYDGDCGFCRSSVLLIQQFLLLPRESLAPAQDNPRARTLLQANNSWVVIDSDEQAHMKWPAFAVMLRHSPLLFWLWPLVRMKALATPGNAVYDWVARHRPALGRIDAAMATAPAMNHEIPPRWQGVAAASLVAVLLWNLGTVQAMPHFVTAALSPAMRLLRLDQDWNLFAPAPLKEDGWLVLPAKLADGSEIDLLHPDRGAPDYSKPRNYSQTHVNAHWNSYLAHLWEPSRDTERDNYARYLCRQWNRQHGGTPAKRLMTFKMIHMLEHTPPPGEPAQLEQVVLSRHECFPQETKGQVP